MARIFVSYRRQDSAGHAGRIYDRLRAFFGSGRVFMDVEGIDLGADFTKALDERIVGAEVVIAVIGPHWISASVPDGQRRLFSESDYVRYELATALARGIEVIPVLVAGAEAPSADELPEELADLANRQMYVISDIAMDAGMARLIRGVERCAARTREMRRLLPRTKSRFRERWLARLLLLYEPSHPALWLLHIPFFTILMLSVFTPVIIWKAGIGVDKPVRLALQGFFAMFIWLAVIRAVVLVLEPDAVVGPLRRWFLLYNPPRAIMTIVHLMFLMMVLFCLITPVVVVEAIRQQPNDVLRAVFVQTWIIFVVLTLVVRQIGASSDPLRPVLSEPNWFVRFLCIWKPQHAVAWFPRIVYYAACFLIFLMFPRVLVGPDGNFGNVSWEENSGLVVLLVVLAAITISARGAARAGEVGWPDARDASPVRRVRSILLLYVPWRRAGWAASGLFFVGLGFLIALMAGRDHTLKLLGVKPVALTLLAVLSTILVVCAWSWAQLYRPPAHWNESGSDIATSN